jgi:hypothetical protein
MKKPDELSQSGAYLAQPHGYLGKGQVVRSPLSPATCRSSASSFRTAPVTVAREFTRDEWISVADNAGRAVGRL